MTNFATMVWWMIVGKNMSAWDNLKRKGFKVIPLNGVYQYRINDVLDLYPVNQRWHDITHNERGSYDYGREYEFVTQFFKRYERRLKEGKEAL